MSKKLYFVQVEGMIDGAHRVVNDELNLTDREAKYLVMSGLVATEKKGAKGEAPAEEPDAASLGMKTRKA